jgi:hypothetical protein
METHKTNNYEIFGKLKGNRPVHDYHVMRLALSMKERGFLPHLAIEVNASMEVIDGQHRLSAAKLVGCPVFYTVIEGDAKLNRELNALTKKWTTEDYLKSYCEVGHPEYLKLQELMNDTGFPIAVFTSLFSVVLTSFANGKYVHKFGQRERDVLKIVSALKAQGIKSGERKVVLAAMAIAKIENFDLFIMLERIKTYPTKFVVGHNTDSCLDSLVALYNYRTREQNMIVVPPQFRRK